MRQSRNKKKKELIFFLPPLFDCCVCKQRIVVSLAHAEGWCQSLNIGAITNVFFSGKKQEYKEDDMFGQ